MVILAAAGGSSSSERSSPGHAVPSRRELISALGAGPDFRSNGFELCSLRDWYRIVSSIIGGLFSPGAKEFRSRWNRRRDLTLVTLLVVEALVFAVGAMVM